MVFRSTLNLLLYYSVLLSIARKILKYMVDLIPLIFGNMMSGSVSDFHNQLF